ncbi:MAG: chromosome segregation protein SMC [Methanocellales archaeon]
MYIKEIVLQNFKSFGKKVTIPFFDDFTAVSGPNGSGKSNIIDSILFALGLSTSKTMRAEKLTDLIYKDGNGKSPDFAEVTVKFDNRDRELPINSDEVVITRRIKQTESGYYSYFYLNDRACSLSEIQNQLAKARITPDCFNVILQGDVTRIIEMSPIERRRIIDEIAGVAEFDEKTDQAYDELNIVRERIERVDIILSEVEARLKQLEGERAHALKYQKLREEKKRYEGMILISKLKSTEQDLESTISEINSKQARVNSLKAELEKKKAVLLELESKLNALNAEVIAKGEGEQIQIKREIEALLSEQARCKNAIEFSQNEIQELEDQRKRIFFEIDKAQNRIREIENKIAEEEIRRKSVLLELEDKYRKLELVNQKITQVDEEYVGVRNSLFELRAKLENVKADKNEFLRLKDRLLDSLRRKNSEINNREQAISEAKKQLDEIEIELGNLERELKKLEEQKNEIELEERDLEVIVEKAKRELNEIEQKLRALQQEYAKAEAMVKIAEEMSKYSPGVELILQAKKQKELPGIYGTIAELGKVDSKYAIALEIAAGVRMQCIVTETDEDAARAIEYLKKRDQGRVTFLPLNKMQPKPYLKELPAIDGIIDYAINLISYDPKFDAAFWYVFSDTIIVANLDIARKLIGKYRMATLEGELIEKAGAITGGSVKSRFKFAVYEEEKLKLIAEEIAVQEAKQMAAARKFESIQASKAALQREKQVTSMEMEKLRLQQIELSEKKQKLVSSLQIQTSEIDNLEREKKNLGIEIAEVDRKIQIKEEEASNLSKEIEKLEKQLQSSEIPSLAREADRLENEIRRFEARINEIQANIGSLNLENKFIQSRIEELRERAREIEVKRRELEGRIAINEKIIEELKAKLEEKRRRERDLECELMELKNDREMLLKEIVSKRSDLDSIQRELDRIESWIKMLEVAKAELCKKIEQMKMEIQESGVETLEVVLSIEEINAKIAMLEKEMLAMEPVNMRAIAEYEEVLRRQQELIDKRNTLSRERAAIIDRIEQYRLLKKQTFMVTFEGINLNFKDIFKELCDGKGELLLENPDSPFEGGLSIVAHPRDRPAQRLEALSGGEKSITALAFIFAIQRYKPAPFYVFDEIDMFLDGVNAERVARMIKKASEKAQFIVVTLRKPMIESAAYTIGVTMQHNNISTITGVRLNQSAA